MITPPLPGARQKPNAQHTYFNTPPSNPPDPQLNKASTIEEIETLMTLLPPDKAAGLDGITNRMLQCGGEEFLKLLHLYICIIWETECYPEPSTSALMQPVYKAGGNDRYDPASYRGIYLLNTLSKLFEGLIESRLTPFKELHNTLTSAQQGSRPGRQTHDAIYALMAVIQASATQTSIRYAHTLLLHRLWHSLPLSTPREINPTPPKARNHRKNLEPTPRKLPSSQDKNITLPHCRR
jgi:hypothetical protein